VARRPVHLVSVAKVGGRSADLDGQIDKMLTLGEPHASPDVAMLMVGANDVTNRVKVPEAVDLLGQAVRRLRSLGAEVVVGTCPDFGAIEPVAPPLRWIARRWSRQLAAAQTITVVEAGGRSVSLGAILGPEFAARPADMFGPDRFHPSAEGYARAASVVLPSVAAALRLVPDDADDLDRARGESVLTLDRAAVRAAASEGAEVTGAQVVDEEQRRDRRLKAVGAGWALLRQRRR
jgi:lysophospholipase L1-like esterase